jgi:hypothetical protein
MKTLSITLLAFLFSGILFAQVGINEAGSPPDPKAMLDVSATDKGLLPPRLTTVQRDAISSPIPDGLLIYNSTIGCMEYYRQAQWYSMCGTCPAPQSAPTAGSHMPSESSITWNWNAVSGAQGYKWNTSANYNSATDLGNATSVVQGGLTCNTSQSIYVWAYNSCGHTGEEQFTSSTSPCPWVCGTPLTVTHTIGDVAPATATISYGTVSTAIAGTGTKCWITRNLGASAAAVSANDAGSAAMGWFWQFNRKQGYAYSGSTTPAWTITSINETSNWLPANDPCDLLLGAGWRIPTLTEWTNADGAPQNWASLNDTYASVLKLHGAGIISGPQGTIDSPGVYAGFWTSVEGATNLGRALTVSNGDSGMNSNNKANGFSVRCLKD